ncbi:MAG: hypothetical protein F4X34_08825 [Chloroflexi bacterium]|nr:hypothetical protein [Chloroflexota bacterium]
MSRTIEAIIDKEGHVRLLETISLSSSRRALVTILEDEEDYDSRDVMLASEAALAVDWNRHEEDEAWSHLQQEK